jgi:hypothetical protein
LFSDRHSEVGATFAIILVTWLQNQSGRAIRATLVDDVFDLQTAEDVEGFVDKINQFGPPNCRVKGAHEPHH